MVRFSASQNSCDLTLTGAFLGSCRSLLGKPGLSEEWTYLKKLPHFWVSAECLNSERRGFVKSIKRHKIRAQYNETLAF